MTPMTAQMMLVDVKPGMWAVVNTGSRFTGAIEFAEKLASHGRRSAWDHAVIASRWVPDETGGAVLMIVEAEPGGAREVPWHYGTRPHLWCAGEPGLWSPAAAHAALGYAGYSLHPGGEWVKTGPGVGYSAADYFYIGAHAWHIPVPGLRDKISTTRRMICSQLVDQSQLDAGVHEFDDERWPGDVMPTDLGALLGQP